MNQFIKRATVQQIKQKSKTILKMSEQIPDDFISLNPTSTNDEEMLKWCISHIISLKSCEKMFTLSTFCLVNALRSVNNF